MKTTLRYFAVFIFAALFLPAETAIGQKYYHVYAPSPALPSWSTQYCRQWVKSYGSWNNEWVSAMQPTSDGGFIMAGYSTGLPNTRLWVVKTDADGNTIWQNNYGGSNSVEARSIQQTAEGGYIMAGYKESGTREKDFWIVKTDAGGNVQWEKTLGGTGRDDAYTIVQTNDNGYIVAGTTESGDEDVVGGASGWYNYWVVKLNSSGNLVWQKKLEASQRPYSIRQTNDGGYIIAGDSPTYFNQTPGPDDPYDEGAFFVLKLNASGDFQWQLSLGTYRLDGAFDIILTSDGNYVAAGYTTSVTNTQDQDWNGLIVKISPAGNVLWQTQVDFSLRDEIRSIRETADGGFIFCGNTDYLWNNQYGTYDPTDFWVGKLDANGQLVWQGALGSPYEDAAVAIAPTGDGSYAIAGTVLTRANPDLGIPANNDYLLVKLEPGCTIQQYNGRYRQTGNIVHVRGSRNSSARSNEEDGTSFLFRDELNRLMATVTSAGDSPLGGNVTTTAWVDMDQSPRYVRRHYEITPDDAAATATGTVTLYFSQADFDTYNNMAGADRKLPANPGDAAGKANFRIVKYSGASGNDDGLPESYSGGLAVIDPDDVNIVWNSSLQIWEVTFDVTGFSGFFATDAITSESPLPVTFTAIEAFIKEGILIVNWTVGNETNNAWYLVETSADGKNFEVVSDKILSKAQNGDSSATLKYSFIKSYSLLQGMAALLVLVVGLGRKNRKAAVCIAVISCLAFTLSCRELTADIESRADKKLYVRIVQVDEDGSRNYSRIVTAQP